MESAYLNTTLSIDEKHMTVSVDIEHDHLENLSICSLPSIQRLPSSVLPSQNRSSENFQQVYTTMQLQASFSENLCAHHRWLQPL